MAAGAHIQPSLMRTNRWNSADSLRSEGPETHAVHISCVCVHANLPRKWQNRQSEFEENEATQRMAFCWRSIDPRDPLQRGVLPSHIKQTFPFPWLFSASFSCCRFNYLLYLSELKMLFWFRDSCHWYREATLFRVRALGAIRQSKSTAVNPMEKDVSHDVCVCVFVPFCS